MHGIISKLLAPSFFFFVACGPTMQVANEVQSGRAELRLSNPKSAISHFEQAGRLNPGYITDFTPLKIGVWTYAGRAYYESGERDKALVSLKRAREQHHDDYVASLYLGILLIQEGRSQPEGAKLVEEGLTALHAWLEAVPSTIQEGRFWDPGGYLRKTMSQTLAMLRAKQTDWKAVTENVGWLGQKLDEEIEEVRKQKDREREDDGKQDGAISSGGR
jgi:tetratricopeptide (TPR) repeat protein